MEWSSLRALPRPSRHSAGVPGNRDVGFARLVPNTGHFTLEYEVMETELLSVWNLYVQVSWELPRDDREVACCDWKYPVESLCVVSLLEKCE